MSDDYPPVEVKVWGDFALFCRPEAKVERVSYEVPTPSAARGILEAIYWHKPMKWRVREIVVLNRVRHFSLLRNEVTQKASAAGDGIFITDNRTQRHSLCLRNVAYVIQADAWLPPGGDPTDVVKHRDQFRRRVRAGQCFHRPYLGCREFAANFAEPDGTEEPDPSLRGARVELGRMLFDVDYGADTDGTQNTPRFFDAVLENGVLRVPPELYEKGGTA